MSSLTSHGNITSDNLQEAMEKTNLYGPKRVKMSRDVKKILNKLGATWTIDGGTLMGAWRDCGKMLPHDDDFDFVVHAPGIYNSDENRDLKCIEFLHELKKFFDESLNPNYECRIVDTYCKKLEIYEPCYGKYPFTPLPHIQTDYHNVTCDVMLLLSDSQDPWHLYIQHEKMRHTKIHVYHFFPPDIHQPNIYYEGSMYNSPYDPENYLKDLYGYIGKNAVYNPETGFYESQDSSVLR